MLAFDEIRVLDFTTFLAGSYSTLYLSDMGADVIKVETPDGDPYRTTAAAFMSVNRGKRSLSIDLKKNEARAILHKLLKKTDILTSNTRPAVMGKLGLDYNSVRELKPDIIYYSSPAHGSKGSLVAYPGFDPIFQARSGLMRAQGGPESPPMYHKIAVNDVCAPVIGDFGIALALLVRAKTGKGQLLETSLTHSAVALQATNFIQHKKVKRSYIKDSNPKGSCATSRLYLGLDGRWFFLHCEREEHWQCLCKATNQGSLSSDPRFASARLRKRNDSKLAEILFELFTLANAADWVSILQEAGVPAGLSQTEEELFRDPHCTENNMFMVQDHPQLGPSRMVGFFPQFSELEASSRRPSPLLGQHTTEILKEINYTDEEIDNFLTAKVVFQSAPVKPLSQNTDDELQAMGFTADMISRMRSMK